MFLRSDANSVSSSPRRAFKPRAALAAFVAAWFALAGSAPVAAQTTSGTAAEPVVGGAGRFGANRRPGLGTGGGGGGGAMREAMRNMTPEERQAAMEKMRARRQARMAAAGAEGTTAAAAMAGPKPAKPFGGGIGLKSAGFGNPGSPGRPGATANPPAPAPGSPAPTANVPAPQGREALRLILESFTPDERAAARAYFQGLTQEERQGLGARMKRTPQEQRPELLKSLVKSGKPPTTVEGLRTKVGLAPKTDLGPPLTIAAKETGTGDYRRSGLGSAGTIPRPGAPAPDLKLPKAEGVAMLATRPAPGAGRPMVVLLGSITSPAYRARIAQFGRMSTAYGSKADFLVIYTTEAHPSGSASPFADREWVPEKNREDKVTPAQPATMEARRALAMETRSRFGETLPIAVDGMDNAAWKAFGARADAAFLIGADGKVAIAQESADPEALELALSKL